jgi:hypothetical protein
MQEWDQHRLLDHGCVLRLVLGIGVALKRYMKTSADFFLGGVRFPRGFAVWLLSPPTWGPGSHRYVCFWRQVCSVPEYLRLRFDEKTRGLQRHLLKVDVSDSFKERIARAYREATGIIPEIYVCEPAQGAQAWRDKESN